MTVGFDDGYCFMATLEEGGWIAVNDKGSWPHVVYLVRRAGEKRAIVGYCEGDLTVWEFADEAGAQEFAHTLS